VIELIDVYGNDRIGFRSDVAGTLNAYDQESKFLGKVELASPRAGWHEFKPLAGARSYVFGPAI
jgi:hypothetical protein